MNRIGIRRILTIALLVVLLAGTLPGCAASGSSGSKASLPDDLQQVTGLTAAALIEQNPQPAVSAVGGDWLIKALVCSGSQVDESYYRQYYDNVRAAVKSSGGVLSETHYTEYERVIIGLSAIGEDVRDVEGYDLTPYLDAYEQVTEQGPNAACFALIAAREAGLTLTQEDAYVSFVIAELSDPAFEQDRAYADYLAIGIEGLAAYQDRPEVAAFIAEAAGKLSDLQQPDGSFGNCEATAECIAALVQTGIDPLGDERFIKDGKTLGDGLMVYYLGDGAFCHMTEQKQADQMACEKALLAMDAIRLYEEGGKLYE